MPFWGYKKEKKKKTYAIKLYKIFKSTRSEKIPKEKL